MKLSLLSTYAGNRTGQAGNEEIKAGQIIKGTVKQLYPGQQAAVTVNGRVYHASLEAPVETGKSYYFHVKNDNGRQVWQVAANGAAASADKSQALLKQLGLSPGKQEQYIFRMFEQMQLPVTRETLQKSVQLLKGEGAVNKQGMQTIQWMLAAGAPLKTSVFQSVHQVLHGPPMAQDLTALLARHKTSEAVHQSLSSAVLTPGSFKGDLEAPTKPMQLFAAAAAAAASDKNGQAAQLIHRLFASMQPPLNAEAFLQHVGQAAISSGSVEKWLQSQVENAERLHQTIQQLPGKAPEMSAKALMKAWHPLLPEAVTMLANTPQMVEWLKSYAGSASWSSWAESGTKEAMQTSYRHLEQAQAHIMSRNEFSPQHERTVAHVAGQQLMQQNDQAAWLQQLSHLPAKWGEMLSDAVVHWEGKRTEDGKLDPDTCHILFQLEMDRLGVLLADVQIYKRNVTINISSENPRPEQPMHLFQPMLKTAMASLNYELVSLQWHEEEAAPVKPYGRESGPKGAFDIRI